MRRLHFLFLFSPIVLLSCTVNHQVDFVKPNGSFLAYQNTAFSFLDKQIDADELIVECDCNYFISDSLVHVNSKPGTHLRFELNGSVQSFLPEGNPQYNPQWEELDLGESPTPLTQEQVWVYQNYVGLKLLN